MCVYVCVHVHAYVRMFVYLCRITQYHNSFLYDISLSPVYFPEIKSLASACDLISAKANLCETGTTGEELEHCLYLHAMSGEQVEVHYNNNNGYL